MSQSPQERDVIRRQGQRLDDELQRELDAALGEMSIEDLLDKEERAERGEPAAAGTSGSIRRGRVVAVDARNVLVDLGSKSQGIVPVDQFEGKPPQVGETVELVFDRYDRAEGLVVLSRRGAVAAAAWGTLEEGQVVEGRVTGLNKGGLELDINGIRGFMPASQVDLYHVNDISVFLNERVRCQVTDLDRQAKNLVVSRRALLELEREQKREQFWNEVEVDQVRAGVVRNIMPYGAFVDLDGADGLLHISDLAYGRVNKVEDVLQPGQQVQVKIIKVDREARKLSLGLKQLQADPWTTIAIRYQAGQRVQGPVTRVADFGAFVEIEPGVEGLVPVSEMSWARVNHPRDAVSPGQVVELTVLSVDADRKRMSLSLKQVQANPWTGVGGRYSPEMVVPVTIRRLTDFGAFVELEPGVEGLIHVSQISDKRIKHPSDALKVDQQVQARIISVNEEERKISLTLKSAPAGAAEQPAADQPSAVAPPPPKKKRERPLKGGLDRGFMGGGLGDLKL